MSQFTGGKGLGVAGPSSQDRQQEMMTAMFDIVESVIQKWIATSLDKTPQDCFSIVVEEIKSTFIHEAASNQHYELHLEMKDIKTLDIETRVKQLAGLSKVSIQLGRIINAYSSALGLVYNSTMKVRDFTCSDEMYAVLQNVKFILDTNLIIWKPNDEVKSTEIFVLNITPIDGDKVVGIAHLGADATPEEFIADVDSLNTEQVEYVSDAECSDSDLDADADIEKK